MNRGLLIDPSQRRAIVLLAPVQPGVVGTDQAAMQRQKDRTVMAKKHRSEKTKHSASARKAVKRSPRKRISKRNRKPAPSRRSSLQAELERASDGLVYSTEAEFPFRFFSLPGEFSSDGGRLTLEAFLNTLGLPLDYLSQLKIKTDDLILEMTLDLFLFSQSDKSTAESSQLEAISKPEKNLEKSISQCESVSNWLIRSSLFHCRVG